MTSVFAKSMCFSFALFAASLVCCAGPVEAQVAFDRSEQDEALDAMRRGEILDFAKIRRRAEVQLGGRMVGARLRRTNSGWVYEVRMLKRSGNVHFVVLDARTGKKTKNQPQKKK